MNTTVKPINVELRDAVNAISWQGYPFQNPNLGLQFVKENDCIFIEGGGGQSTKEYLDYIAKNGGKLVTLDLCSRPDDSIIFNGSPMVGYGGNGDYSSKKTLFDTLAQNEVIKKNFSYFFMRTDEFWDKMAADITFRKEILNGKEYVDYYFDDACHDSIYLVPQFKTILPLCRPGTILGTHDYGESSMKELLNFMEKQPNIKVLGVSGDSFFWEVINKEKLV
jgi:hypothetical protein